jgi:hypothetical protein
MILIQTRPRAPACSRSVFLAVLWTIGGLCALLAPDMRGASAAQARVPPNSAPAPAKKRTAHNQKQDLYFERRYGIGQLRVRSISSGASVEFRCQVLDAEKAKALKDARAVPVMIERKTGAKLSAAGDSGKSHQAAAPEAGQEYWVAFGNRGNVVKPGNLVDVVIGRVHVSGLIVE